MVNKNEQQMKAIRVLPRPDQSKIDLVDEYIKEDQLSSPKDHQFTSPDLVVNRDKSNDEESKLQ